MQNFVFLLKQNTFLGKMSYKNTNFLIILPWVYRQNLLLLSMRQTNPIVDWDVYSKMQILFLFKYRTWLVSRHLKQNNTIKRFPRQAATEGRSDHTGTNCWHGSSLCIWMWSNEAFLFCTLYVWLPSSIDKVYKVET